MAIIPNVDSSSIPWNIGSSSWIGSASTDWTGYVQPSAINQTIVVKTEEAKPPMRGLFEVYIVDPERGDILGPFRVVAKDESAAKLKVVSRHLDSDKLDIDDYDVIVRRIGDVRPKKVIQTVKIAP